MRLLLLPLSWVYALATGIRNLAFDAGFVRIRKVSVPVVSVGNLTAGGTGKTPLVEYLLPRVMGKGFHPSVVSRGFGRASSGVVIVSRGGRILADARGGGDEPVQIARKFPQVSVVVGERRADAAEVAVKECGADVVLLDDGFQHRWLYRDLNIVILDARENVLKEALLPAGMKREANRGLRRASIVGLSHADPAKDPSWIRNLDRLFEGKLFFFRTCIDAFFQLGEDGGTQMPEIKGRRLVAFSGIGDHAAFLSSLKDAGCTIVGDKAFGDHHEFTDSDIRKILVGASAVNAEGCITTEKDMTRLLADHTLCQTISQAVPVFYATIRVEIVRGEEVLEGALDVCLHRLRI
jgi:tetraacyldisaccharide 4'-kinase